MSFSVVIPARYGSSRLPGKPLLDIAGKPMVQHVYERAAESNAAQVIVATDDDRIVAAVQAFGGEVCMTSDAHPSGTDRLQEVASKYALDSDSIIVNVQGDEPLIPATVINQVANNLASADDTGIATLCEPIQEMQDILNPNIVKVVSNQHGRALYFSRAPIPWDREAFSELMVEGHKALSAASSSDTLADRGSSSYYRHIGIYAYRVNFLNQFVTWPVSPIENIEKLEQLRAMDNGVGIHVDAACDPIPGGVDTEEDLAHVREVFASRNP